MGNFNKQKPPKGKVIPKPKAENKGFVSNPAPACPIPKPLPETAADHIRAAIELLEPGSRASAMLKSHVLGWVEGN